MRARAGMCTCSCNRQAGKRRHAPPAPQRSRNAFRPQPRHRPPSAARTGARPICTHEVSALGTSTRLVRAVREGETAQPAGSRTDCCHGTTVARFGGIGRMPLLPALFACAQPSPLQRRSRMRYYSRAPVVHVCIRSSGAATAATRSMTTAAGTASATNSTDKAASGSSSSHPRPHLRARV